MRAIWKFAMPPGAIAVCQIGPDSTFRHAGIDPASGEPAIWVEVYPDAFLRVERLFQCFATGEPIPPGWEYRATVIAGQYVWHIHEAA